MGNEKPLRGEASMGDHMVFANYFAQNQAEALEPGRTVLGTLEEAAGEDMAAPDIKSLLGKMGFKGEAHDKTVENLSGGEKARLALAKFMVTPASLLLLVRFAAVAHLMTCADAFLLPRRTSRQITWTFRPRRCWRRRCPASRCDPVTCAARFRSLLTRQPRRALCLRCRTTATSSARLPRACWSSRTASWTTTRATMNVRRPSRLAL